MLRSAVTLLALSGCDVVFGLPEIPTGEAECGPYADAVPLTFGPGITTPTDFSTNAAETFGLVHSGTGYVAVVPAGGDTWILDPDAQRQAVPPGLVSAHLGPSEDTMFGSVTLGGGLAIIEYHFGPTWRTAATAEMPDPQFTMVPGSEVDLGPNQFHYLTLTKLRRSGFGNRIALTRATPVDYTVWEEDPRLGEITDDTSAHGPDPIGAVQTSQGLILLYAAIGPGGDADLYATSRPDRNSDWPPGAVFVAPINDAMDELEPWTNDDCSHLYFRRRAAGDASDPGTILIAHQQL